MKSLLRLIAAWLVLQCQAVGAVPITYQVIDLFPNLTSHIASGTITTDGTLGSLSATNILAWTFDLDTGTYGDFSLDSTHAGANVTCGPVCNLSADANALYFDFRIFRRETDYTLIFFDPETDTSFGGPTHCGGECVKVPGLVAYVNLPGSLGPGLEGELILAYWTLGDNYWGDFSKGIQPIARVPEPATLGLLLFGVAGLIFGRRNKPISEAQGPADPICWIK